MAASLDLVVIGGGPGGYVAAIRAAQLGLSVACVDKRAALGGTCLNIGCIPSKALLRSSEKFAEARHALAQHGVKVAGVELDLAAMMARKSKVVDDLTKGIAFLFRKNKVAHVEGAAAVEKPGAVRVAAANGERRTLEAKHVLIATGSEVMPLPGVPIERRRLPSRNTCKGETQKSTRLPGAMRFTDGIAASMSNQRHMLFRNTPVPSATRPQP